MCFVKRYPGLELPLYKYNIPEMVVVEIVTPRKYIVNRGGAEVDNDFRGVTISTTTLSGMLYLLYYTDPLY